MIFLYSVSGGFIAVNPDSTCNITAVEAVPLEQIDFDVGCCLGIRLPVAICSLTDPSLPSFVSCFIVDLL